MALPSGTWNNSDGLLVKFHGQYDIANPPFVNRARAVNNEGPTKYLVVDFDLETVGASATWYPFDLNNDGTNDGFSNEEPYLPSGSQIIRAWVKTTEIAVGGTDFTVGTYQVNGTVIDADGIVNATNGAIANMGTVGEMIIASGDLIGDASGTVGLTADSWIAVTTNGTFSAGKGTLYIEYV